MLFLTFQNDQFWTPVFSDFAAWLVWLPLFYTGICFSVFFCLFGSFICKSTFSDISNMVRQKVKARVKGSPAHQKLQTLVLRVLGVSNGSKLDHCSYYAVVEYVFFPFARLVGLLSTVLTMGRGGIFEIHVKLHTWCYAPDLWFVNLWLNMVGNFLKMHTQ